MSPDAAGGRPPGRPRIATIRWTVTSASGCTWRSPSEATEDRNGYGLWLLILTGVCRLAVALQATRIATTLRSWGMNSWIHWRSPSGVTEDRNQIQRWIVIPQGRTGGRPLGRPRIAIPRVAAARSSPSRLAAAFCGDRESKQPAQGLRATESPAVALRGDPDSQRRHSCLLGQRRHAAAIPTMAEDRNPAVLMPAKVVHGCGGRPLGQLARASSPMGSMRPAG